MKTKTSLLTQQIKDGKFDYVNSDIEKNLTAEDIRGELKVFHFDRNISSEDAVAEMAKENYLPANLSELLVYSKEEWNEKDWVVALGSVAEVRGLRRVPCLVRDEARRDLDLHWWGGGWVGRYRFLAVRNSDSVPQSYETALSLSGSLSLEERVARLEKIITDGSVCQKCLGRCCEKCEATIEKGLYTCGDSSCLCHQTEQADTVSEVETLSAKLHDIYQEEVKRQIGHSRHHDDYAKLPESVKDLDRVLARFIISLLQKKEAEHQQCADEMTKQIEEAYERGKAEVTN